MYRNSLQEAMISDTPISGTPRINRPKDRKKETDMPYGDSAAE